MNLSAMHHKLRLNRMQLVNWDFWLRQVESEISHCSASGTPLNFVNFSCLCDNHHPVSHKMRQLKYTE